LAIGRTDLMIFAVLGAFTGAYGRGLSHRSRFEQQWRAGGLLLFAITAGTLCSQFTPAPAVIVALTAVVAALGFVASSLRGLKPKGSLFFVFAFSAISFMPTAAPFWPAVGTAVASVLVSLVIGVAGRVLPGHHAPWVSEPCELLSVEERRNIYIEALLHLVSVAICGTIAIWVGFGHNYWAMIAGTAPLTGATATHRVTRGVQRILGTFGGLAITGVLLSMQMLDWQLVVVALVLQFLVELFVARNYALAQLFVTPLALIMTEVAHPASPWLLIRDRGIETVIGATVGIALVVVLDRATEMRTVQV
jgi:hypothetical protein